MARIFVRIVTIVLALGGTVCVKSFAQTIGPDGRVLPAYSGGYASTPTPAPPVATVTPPPAPALATIITPMVAPAPVTRGISVVPDGTEVDLKLAETISSARAMEGQRIRFTVAKDVA